MTNPSFTADLSSLKALISGGESNVVATCDELARELRRLGTIYDEVIRPSFGMTETCAGCIYSRACPSYDLARSLEFASLESYIPKIDIRVMNITEPSRPAATGELGELQVSGPVVFDQYYNAPTTTRDSFTSDGWFITGDLAWIDDVGNLNLTGRIKDTVIINASKLETTVEQERIAGLVPRARWFSQPVLQAGRPRISPSSTCRRMPQRIIMQDLKRQGPFPKLWRS
ncbi:hypothetical protein VTO42DRAFT_761 [Malbranchea cinnamomea]